MLLNDAKNVLKESVTKDFLACVSISKLKWQVIEDVLREANSLDKCTDSDENMLNIQEEILSATVHHPLSLKYPPTHRYLQNFLKTLISKVEEYKCEIHNDLLETHTGLMCKSSQQDGEGFKTYVINEAITMSLKEKASIISDGTTGLCTWQAAFYLAEWCIQHAEFFREKTVIELGSGSGLVGLTCLKMCRPKSVTLTDHHSKVLESLQCNVQINNHSQRESTDTHVQVRSLDWIEFSQNKDTLDADIVLASDVVFDVELIPPLATTTCKVLQQSATSFAVVACTVRNEDTLQSFLTEIASRGLSYKLLDHAPPVFNCDRPYPVHLYHITSSSAN